jgi:chromosome segregation protein
MLKIDQLEIHGFKSFCDRTDVRFQSGITAVVGPNGCGKSNIGDALHWVLGEQSARTLRGGRMEDVIFAGTESRGPHGMAEVSLHFKGEAGDLPSGETTAIVSRRLFRSGESEYLLNGRKVRLRDIHEMLQAARVGATTYAVIEQGKVDAILSAKPRDRRQLIEEAAGIIGYKQKRHLTELKLEATQANLLRIHDVILEVRRQINALKRQAARARRYSRVRDELRGLESRILAARARALQADAERARAALGEAQEREAQAAATLARHEAELEAAREGRRGVEAAIAGAREEMHRLAREVDHEESVIREEAGRAEEARREAARLAAEMEAAAARLEEAAGVRASREAALTSIDEELARLETALASLGTEETAIRDRANESERYLESRRAEQVGGAARLAGITNTLAHLQKELERLEGRGQRLGAELDEARREERDLAARTDEAREHGRTAAGARESALEAAERRRKETRDQEESLRALAESVAVKREDLARLDERVRSLEDVEHRLAGIGAGARWLLTGQAGRGAEVRGVVADFLDVRPESEKAVEGYLGPFLAAVVVPTGDSALSLVGDLHRAEAGRAVFAPEEATAPAGADGAAELGALASEPGVLGRLAELVSTTNGISHLLSRRLAGAVLVKDLRAALDLARRHPGRDYVTPAGEVVARDGTIEGGHGVGSEDGLLARRRLLESTRASRQQAFEALASAEEAKSLLEVERDKGTRELEQAERRLQEAERGAALAQERESGLTAEKERGAKRAVVLEEEIAALRAETAATEAQRLADAAAHQELEESLARETLALDARRREMDVLREQADALAGRLAEERLARAAVRERRRHTADDVVRFAGEIAGMEDARRLAGERREEALARAAASDAAGVAARDRLAAHMTAHAEAQSAFASAEEALRACDAAGEALEEGARAARAVLDAAREARRQSEMAAAYAESELRHLDERSRTTLDEDLASLLARVPEEPDVDLTALDEETASLRSKIDAMGPVNLLAIQEFQELEERYAFFEKQEKDLTDAIESLKETIRRINRTSRERFLEAFEAVRANFNETFSLLFGGGRGDIRLMEDEDPLDCGLEINVQPPGKRLQSLMLLSGGEKALSAIALLFAIFRYQPSPFCLLDEVDAALDESNVRRFTRLLKEFAHMTQFIVITHNKRSMEAADTLYGVTMDEPGISKLVSVNLAEGGLAQIRAPERATARTPRRPRRDLDPDGFEARRSELAGVLGNGGEV